MIEGSKIGCYLRTVRPLKPIQIYWRLRTRALAPVRRRQTIPLAGAGPWPENGARQCVTDYLVRLRAYCPPSV